MKSSKKRAAAERAPVTRPSVAVERAPVSQNPWLWGGLALFAAFLVYFPALDGPFVYDDRYLPFFQAQLAGAPLSKWLHVRPLLMLSFWLNLHLNGVQPFAYHAVNVLLHAGAAVLVGVCTSKLLALAGAEAGRRTWLAAVAAAIFLVHPVQTESVAYVASRSEVLSVGLLLAAYAVFLAAGDAPVRFGRVAAILALFAGAFSTKEHTAVLPGLLLLTDLYFYSGLSGVKRNWRLYAILGLGLIPAVWMIRRVLIGASSAGFAIQSLPWTDYLFTQFRVIWNYVRLYVLPVGLNLDHDVPVSRGLGDPMAWAGLAALLGAAAAAWYGRRKYRLASFGFFVFLLLLAPTSSVLPIRDVMAEHRLYLPVLGLLFITVDLLRRARWDRRQLTVAASAAVAVLALLTLQRNRLWGDPVLLWKDTAESSPKLVRPQSQYAFALMDAGRCAEGAAAYQKAAELNPKDAATLVNWALALDCAGQADAAVARLRDAAAIEPTAHVYSLLGMMHGKAGRTDAALAALAEAERLDPKYAMTYFYRGNVFAASGQPERALTEYANVLELEPEHPHARQAISSIKTQLSRSK